MAGQVLFETRQLSVRSAGSLAVTPDAILVVGSHEIGVEGRAESARLHDQRFDTELRELDPIVFRQRFDGVFGRIVRGP